MKVKKAIKMLNAILEEEGNIEIYLSSDEEGNNHRELYMAQVDWMHPEGGFDGGIGPVANEDVGTEYPEDELTRGVVLW